MKKIITTFLLITILSSFIRAQGVSTSTIEWSSLSTSDPHSGHQTEENTKFITYEANHITWKDPNGSVRKNFQIIEAIGEWPNADQPGRIQYETTDGTFSGTISIQKNESGTKIFITMASDPPESYVLTVGSYEIL